MKEEVVGRKQLLRNWLDSVSVKEFTEIKNQIISECAITRQSFHLWLSGNNVPSGQKRLIINQIALEKGYKKIYNF